MNYIYYKADIGPQSQYYYNTTGTSTDKFDWNITITSFMSIDKPTTEQGIYNLRSTYKLDDRSYDVELFKYDCETAPTGIDDSFPLIWKDASNTVTGAEITSEMEWTYNQTEIEMSDLWTAIRLEEMYTFVSVSTIIFLRVEIHTPER